MAHSVVAKNLKNTHFTYILFHISL